MYWEETQKKQEKETDIRQKRYIIGGNKAKKFLTNIAYSPLNKEGYNTEDLSAILCFVSSERDSAFFGKEILEY